MTIKRINQFPDGSGSLTSDDLFIFMDNPSSGGITKKISLNEISNLISGGGESRSLVTTVFNDTGSPVPKFKAVYINGGQGDMPTIALASASGEMTSSKTYGITAEAINNMSTGKVIVFGALTGLNTDQFNPTSPNGNVNGVTLWLSPSTPGGVTTTKPSAPNHAVAVGTIVRTHQNEGVLEVRIQNGFELEELHNVAINGVTNGQFLQYNSASGLWIPTSSGNFATLQVNGTSVSISGHAHSSSNITDFNTSVSGLISGLLPTISNSGDNRILTSTGTSTGINAESNLTFNGSGLVVNGDITVDNLKLDNNTLSSTSGNIIISPSGNGALQRDSAGNSRGQNAVDWQVVRANGTMVASGNNSVIGGGSNNTASGPRSTVGGGGTNTSSGNSSTVGGGQTNTSSGNSSTVGGGQTNTASGYYSTVGGGYYNTSSGYYSTIGGGDSNTSSGNSSTVGGGDSNTASGPRSTIGGGHSNTASGYYSTVGGGDANTSSGNRSTIGGGRSNTASGYCSTIPGGRFAKASRHGELSHSAGRFTNDGDAQHSILIARRETTDNTANQLLFLDASSSRLTLPAQTSWSFTIKLSAYNSTDNQGGWWIIRGGIRRNNSNNTSLVGSLITESGFESSLNAASVSVVADDTNEALEIRVTGVTGKTIRWVAVVDISQVSFGTP